jgi:F-type H+-transporting ATPase subunit b
VNDSLVTLLAAEGGEEVEGSQILLPAIYDIVWSALSFAIIFFLFWRFVWPQMQKALDARSEGIEQKLDQAEADRAEAAALLEQYRAQLADARAEANRLRSDGQAQRASIVAEARTEADQAARTVTEQSQARLATDMASAKASLSRDVGVLASDLAERIIGANLDPERTSATIDAFIADLEAAPQGGAS